MAASLARRYLFKLLANVASVPLYLLMEAILPRALGPASYGNYNFATSLFQQFFGFMDMGTSTCFYNALSRRQNECSLAAFYLRLCALIGLLGLLAGICLLWAPLGRAILPDMPLWLAPLAALWAFLTWLGRVLRSMNDALGATVPSESARSCISFLALLLLVLLYWQGRLNVGTLFLQQYAMLGAMCVAYWLVSRRHWASLGLRLPARLAPGQGRAYARDFYHYSHPLFVQALLSFFMLAAERWLLQVFDGSAQQGFYALSQKVSMACFLFVSAMTPLVMRELSIAWGRADLGAMGSLLNRFAPLLYAVAAYFSCFTLAEGQALVDFFGGSRFAQALLPVQIMALYPLHQGYGQLASSVFHAAGRTRTLRNLTALECVYGLAAAWFLLAPEHLLGLNLGATGLALKTVGVQFVSVNIYLWLASRFIPFRFWTNLAHQLACPAAMLALALGCRQLTLGFCPWAGESARFFISGLAYTSSVALLALGLPWLLGMDRRGLREFWRRLRRRR